MLGVRCTGNATLVAYDGGPVLATDPWMSEDRAYFGSWVLSRQITPEIARDIERSRYLWLSHGHPDHINPDSIKRFVGCQVLLADHVSKRIHIDLERMGFRCISLPDGQWVQLSQNIRILTYALASQDSALLVEVNGRLFVNLNDSWPLSYESAVRTIASRYAHSYLLMLGGYGDADMINYYTEDGQFVPPAARWKPAPGEGYSYYAKRLGLNTVIPFSSFHKYVRTDSVWANEYVTPENDLARGMDPRLGFVEPFCFLDCGSGEIVADQLPEIVADVKPPESFGDSWSDELSPSDVERAARYFQRVERLKQKLGRIDLVVGGKTSSILLNHDKASAVRLEVPAGSLMQAVEHQIFDDLLIGNFMKVTVLGDEFPYNFADISRFADNGRVFEITEVDQYLRLYAQRAQLFELLAGHAVAD